MRSFLSLEIEDRSALYLAGDSPPLIALCYLLIDSWDMVVYLKAEDQQAKYITVYPDDDAEGVEFMCGEYADGWEALALLLEDQRDALNVDLVLSKKQKKDMEAKITRL